MIRKGLILVVVVSLFSLLFAQTEADAERFKSNVQKKVYSVPSQEQKIRPIQSEKPQAVIRSFFGEGDTLQNDDYPTNCGEYVHYFRDVDYNAAKFSPLKNCTLDSVLFLFWVPPDSAYVFQECSLFVWNDSGMNMPGNRRFAEAFVLPSFFPGEIKWLIWDMSQVELTFSSDFWIGYKKMAVGPPFSIIDCTSTAEMRNMWRTFPTDSWMSWQENDVVIRAMVTYHSGITASEDFHNFGDVGIGCSSNWVLNISNPGTEAVTVSDVTSDQTEFSVNITSFTLNPGAEQDITVLFAPLNVGEISGGLALLTNEETDTLHVSLRGSGILENVAPDITFNPASVSIPSVEHSATINTITITDNCTLEKARLFYRKGGTTSYDSLELQGVGGTSYSGTIPSSSVTPRGVEYYMKAIDMSGNSATSPSTDPGINPHVLRVNVPDLTKTPEQPAGFYRMISVPLNLDDESPDAVLVDDLGSYDNTVWRLFHYQGSDYVEYGEGIESFTSGNGFWLITKNAKTIDSGSGQSVTTASNFVISLQPGWNMIANPFYFDVAWNEVIRDDAVEESFWGYDGQGYVEKSRLVPWEGYFLKNRESYPVNIEIPPKEAGGSTKSGFVSFAENMNLEGEWWIQIRARVGDFCDSKNYIGHCAGSRLEWDAMDLSEPPKPPGDYVALYFPHHNWENYPGCYTTDFRSMAEEGTVWDFRVDTNTPEFHGHLEFGNLSSVPAHLEVFLLDISSRKAVDVRSNEDYAFRAQTGRSFSIAVGPKDFTLPYCESEISVPEEYALRQNYPNPFNAETRICYELPQPCHVTLKIFNLVGQEVRTLVESERDAGYQAIPWDGKNSHGIDVSSGAYLYVLETEYFRQTKSLILLR
ncbi:MAG: T9SS type A sorting domain-containing protein [Gemmatimonadota bacterium]|nr:MAG: T9SS type A sorting domain-containing protein [Gemmatimonadota bacterium]